jgi:VWFA-related protein
MRSQRSFIAIIGAGVLAAATAAAAFVQEPATPKPSPSPVAVDKSQAPTFPSQVEQVIVDVVVTDKKGVPIPNLNQADFTILEDGKPQDVQSFERIALPERPPQPTPTPPPRISSNTDEEVKTGRTFVIVFDDIHMAPFQAHRAKGAVAEFLKTGVQEGDRVTLLAAGGAAWWSTKMMDGQGELMALLKRFDGRNIPDMSPERMSDYEAMRINVYHDAQVADRVARRYQSFGVNPGSQNQQSSSQGGMSGSTADGDPMVMGKASEVYFQAVSKNRITLEVVTRALGALVGAKGRKSMILVSEGFIYDPNLDEFKRVVQAGEVAERKAS